MKIIAFIEQKEIIKKILQNAGLWLAQAQPGKIKGRPQPKIHSPPGDFYTDYCDSQIPHWDDEQTSGSHSTYCISPLPTAHQHYYHQGHHSESRNYQPY